MNDIAAAEGVSNTVTHLVFTHHHSDHAGASSLFGSNVIRIGHEETRRLLRDDDRIVFITSDTFWVPPAPVRLAYVASKGALLGVMRTLKRRTPAVSLRSPALRRR